MDTSQMREIQGLLFDPATGKVYLPAESALSDPIDTGYTFEYARWTGPFGLHFNWPNLNPLGFATHETATAILAVVQERFAHEGLHIGLDEVNRVVGPFTRTVERYIVISRGETAETFNAGWLTNGIIRNGPERAMNSLRAEMRVAGLVP